MLFDIDGTLVRPGSEIQRRHMGAMAAAVAEVTGSAEEFVYRDNGLSYGGVDLSGFTDAGTIAVALRLQGWPDTDINAALPQVVALMAKELDAGGTVPADEDLLPGTVELVRGTVEGSTRIGLSTGNARAVANWKMRCTGLADALRDGGFGDGARRRAEVVVAAVAALADGRPYRGVVVGDTVSDVSAAHAAGLRCLAVSTGGTSAAELTAAGADAVLPRLDDKAARAVLGELLAGARTARPPAPGPPPGGTGAGSDGDRITIPGGR
ncbi:HAD family hydrolase [Micromonospora sp. DT227]|uniref:HAD family hydrolase n=1 Tax=Micromonospora sp. DT227 TaxID=3393433 RepID=UPI003CEE6C56